VHQLQRGYVPERFHKRAALRGQSLEEVPGRSGDRPAWRAEALLVCPSLCVPLDRTLKQQTARAGIQRQTRLQYPCCNHDEHTCNSGGGARAVRDNGHARAHCKNKDSDKQRNQLSAYMLASLPLLVSLRPAEPKRAARFHIAMGLGGLQLKGCPSTAILQQVGPDARKNVMYGPVSAAHVPQQDALG
jgi:hypothetical protein